MEKYNKKNFLGIMLVDLYKTLLYIYKSKTIEGSNASKKVKIWMVVRTMLSNIKLNIK